VEVERGHERQTTITPAIDGRGRERRVRRMQVDVVRIGWIVEDGFADDCVRRALSGQHRKLAAGGSLKERLLPLMLSGKGLQCFRVNLFKREREGMRRWIWIRQRTGLNARYVMAAGDRSKCNRQKDYEISPHT